MIDYYELLQISPNADNETIHRVYKYLAARLHPDNVNTGDVAKFQLVKSAYEVLSNPVRRREHDAKRRELAVLPLSTTIDFMDQLEGETNRRIAVLAVLYYRRRRSPNYPDVNLAELEERMGFPRDYLDFTLWYLEKKKYVLRADNATFSLNAEGVDFVERERVVLPVLNGLLTSNTGTVGFASDGDTGAASEASTENPPTSSAVKTSRGAWADERRTGVDRRRGAPDLRTTKAERRQNSPDRRARGKGRPASD